MTRRRTPRRSVIRLTTGKDAQATYHPYPFRTPVLALDCGPMTVLLTSDGLVTAADLAFARRLAREAARFARAIETRLSTIPERSAA